MKWIAAAVLMTLAGSPAVAQEQGRYQILIGSENEAMFADTASMRRSGSTAYLWIVIVKLGLPSDETHLKSHEIFHCDRRTFELRDTLFYKNYDVVESDQGKSEEDAVIPGALVETAFDYACSGTIPQAWRGTPLIRESDVIDMYSFIKNGLKN